MGRHPNVCKFPSTCWGVYGVILLVCLTQKWTASFHIDPPVPHRQLTQLSRFVGIALRANLGDDNDDDDFTFPEKSRMTDFIADFLRKNAKEDDDATEVSSTAGDDGASPNEYSTYTHLIGIPVDSCHQLMLELESVQRAILYHCPVLVQACIQQAITRLPLLYVKASGPTASSKLFSIVEDVIEDHLLQPVEDDNEVVEDEEGEETLNDDGTRPFTLRFDSLDIDGSKNEVLQVVATAEDSNKLRTIVEELQSRIHGQTGWSTLLPPDPQSHVFRARIPFMRLPDNWDDLLEKPEGTEKDELVFLPSDKGGNGISPIFWGKWIDDDFGTARMREVALFKRSSSQSTGLDEKAFYLPDKFISLPQGNRAMTKQEAYYQDYQEKRFLEAESIQADEAAGTEPEQPQISDDDELLRMTKDRLEALYEMDTEVKKSKGDTASAMEASDVQDDDDSDDSTMADDGRVQKPVDPMALDDWTRGRIQNIVASRAKVQSEKELARSKVKPPIAENEVFRKYKEGTLVPKREAIALAPELPPFPSRPHCVGFWKVLQSPTGFDVEETDSSRTDNLVLRVDGTTAGGPILDQKTRQKAAGGTWRLHGDNLRIRLIIPPGKDRILVMEGTLQLVSAKSDIPLAPSSFGIPEMEARKARSAAAIEDIVYCHGDVWVEDAVTKKNRSDVGRFSLMKLNTPTDPKQFTITIPQPIRNQD